MKVFSCLERYAGFNSYFYLIPKVLRISWIPNIRLCGSYFLCNKEKIFLKIVPRIGLKLREKVEGGSIFEGLLLSRGVCWFCSYFQLITKVLRILWIPKIRLCGSYFLCNKEKIILKIVLRIRLERKGGGRSVFEGLLPLYFSVTWFQHIGNPHTS